MTGINPTQAIILAVLHSGPASGAKIEAETHKLEGHWNVTRSQLYRELPVLHDQGLVIKPHAGEEWKGAEPYAITSAGRRQYVEWYEKREKLSTITRDPWILRQRLTDYTNTSVESRRLLLSEAITATEEALAREREKLNPDPLLIARYEIARSWYLGSLS
jgi:DNA-binding PadR family transcriptional regulator